MSSILTSSIGKKFIMSLAGIFLLLFLLVHLGINLLLILFSSSEYFNVASHFMRTNILIKIFEVVLFGGILLHIFYAIILQIQNWIARPTDYKVANYSQTSIFSKFVIHTAVVVFTFLVIHLMDFYFTSKFGHTVKEVIYPDGKGMEDLASVVIAKFHLPAFVWGYIISFIVLGIHIHHGFQSAFQTLGINHHRYTPIIKGIGLIYALTVTIGFMIIPLVIFYK
jgi:succinate dehydrogenase / fumarate reductase, cytochrome b subunit